jgi:hypothetical protein
MSEESYRTRPEQVDMAQAERAIRHASLIALSAVGVGVAVGYALLPRILEFPAALADRLAFAAQAGVFVLLWVAVGILLVSSTRRLSPQDIGGSAAGPPSERIAIYAAFLQNTLEQAVLAVGLYIALATLVSGRWLSLIVVGVVLFAIGRILFLRGYRRGVRGRSLGMTLTMMPTMLGYILVLALIALRLF